MVPLERYICLHCGYSEEWVENIKDLNKIEDKLKRDEGYDGFV